MARKPSVPELRQANLSREAMSAALPKIDRRIKDIEAFDTQAIADRGDPAITALSAKLDTMLVSIFGHGTIEYDRYRYDVTNLDTAWIGAYETPIEEVREGLKRGLSTAKAHLQAIRSGFLEELEDGVGAMPPPQQPSGASELKLLHPKIAQKCGSLYQSGVFAEAVERSFKVVRDRLRDLTGHETGSEAFGKGRLHIRGASAANVDADFNRAVMFLLMAIDMFRNEKSHTSDANIDDPLRALQYLMMSSLALSFLESAEVKPPAPQAPTKAGA